MWSTVPETLAQLRSQIETVAAEKAELLLRVRRREVVEVDKLRAGIVEVAHEVRDLLLIMMPARSAGILAAAHSLDAAAVLATLSATMRRLLTAISKDGPRALDERKA